MVLTPGCKILQMENHILPLIHTLHSLIILNFALMIEVEIPLQ